MLDHFGVLAVRGVDARKFLQGQLSQDVLGLRADQVVWAGLHNPQGRTLALLRLVPQGETDVLCVLPRELLANALTVLRKYLLRAKATLTDESAMWQIVGLTDDAALARDPGSARHDDGRILWRHASDGRVLALEPHGSEAGGANDANGATDASAASGLDWLRADIAAGLPELTAQTSGEFVAQMLNLDALGGISFNKGCYTGQEVIARAHYRGRVKRIARARRIGNARRWAQRAGSARGAHNINHRNSGRCSDGRGRHPRPAALVSTAGVMAEVTVEVAARVSTRDASAERAARRGSTPSR
jgi:folate-binding protein YgfZ